MKKINGFSITAKQTKEGWIDGTIDGMRFQARVYDEGSQYGIDEGRISKLAVWFDDITTGKRVWVLNYDRGWDIRPKKAADKKMLAALLEYLESLPTAEFWEEIAEGQPFRTCLTLKGHPTNVMIKIDHTGWAQVQDCLTGVWYKRLDPIAVCELLERRK